MKKIDTEEVSLAAWVRNLVMRNPDLTLEQLQEEFDKSGRPAKDKPKDKQVIYQAKNIIKKRWGVDLTELPRNKDGSLNISGLVRLYVDKFGDGATEKKAKSYFAVDGVELKPGNFGNAKTTYLRKKGTKIVNDSLDANDSDSLDANEISGPRARFSKPGKNSRKPKSPSRIGSKSGVRIGRKNDTEVATFDLLLQTKQYIQQVGGVDQARALMDFIEEIQSLG